MTIGDQIAGPVRIHLGLSRAAARNRAEEVLGLVGLKDEEMRRLRGNEVAMIFQDPLTSLDPTKTIGYQVAEPVRLHKGASKSAAMDRAKEVLALVGLPRPAERLGDYPHQLSGGLRQRVMIAMALTCEPKLLIADEPTTALDVTIQAQILALLHDLKDRLGMAMLLITHDMGVIAGHADRVQVMYAGRVAEITDTNTLYRNPRHPYTEALFRSLPERGAESGAKLYSIPGLPPDLTHPPTGCRFAARCEYAQDQCRAEDPRLSGETSRHEFACFFPVGAVESTAKKVPVTLAERTTDEALPEVEIGEPALVVRNLVKEYPITSGAVLRRKIGAVSAVSDISFTVNRGETFGLVGESGCGKTTVGKLITGLEAQDSGSIEFEGRELRAGHKRGADTANIQMMFQDSYAAMNPRMRVRTVLREPLDLQHVGDKAARDERVQQLFREVGLPLSALERYPHEFSGGQRQRVGLARALALKPKLIVADEPVSALDVSIQSQVLNLMKELQADLGLSYLFISHDLSVVRHISDRVAVMYLGKIVETASRDDLYSVARHPYTQALLSAVPLPDPERRGGQAKRERILLEGDVPSPLNPPSGCRFRTRCWKAQDLCAKQEPALVQIGSGPRPTAPEHLVACHFPD